MYLITTDNYDALSRAAADEIAALLTTTPTATLLLATGETPMGLYRELARRRAAGEIDTAALRVVQLDEYLGVLEDDRRSLYRWLRESALAPLGVTDDRVARLRGDWADVDAACRAFDEAVRLWGGIDLSILGLGPNGHLGFNEPPADEAAPTRAVTLTEASIESSARYWGGREQVPTRALTAGMPLLLAARRTLLLVSGERKRAILRRAIGGPVTPEVPASYLQRAPEVTVIADTDAWPGAPDPAAGAAGTAG
jgi:glucosamine-6-phosphate deaminase